MFAKHSQIAVEQRMRIKANAISVCDTVERIVLQQWTQLMDSARVETLEIREWRYFGLQRV
jgi:hypothetical protein